MSNSLFMAIERQQRAAKMIACLGLGRCDRQSAPVLLDSLLVLLQRIQGVAEIVISGGTRWIEFNGPFVTFNCLLRPTEHQQGVSEAVMRLGHIGPLGDGPLEAPDRNSRPLLRN